MDRRRYLPAQPSQFCKLGRHRVAEIFALPFGCEREIGRQQPQYSARLLILALIRQVQAVLRVALKLADKPVHRATPIIITLRGFGRGVNCRAAARL